MFKNYICCIRRDNTFECYSVENFNQGTACIMLVTLDLESFYAKINSVIIDIKTVREGIYKVLDKNQYKHVSTIKKILEFKKTLLASSKDIYIKNNSIFYIYNNWKFTGNIGLIGI